ncbi:Photosystem I reaction center subunit PsaK [Ancylothrix sp. C2]|uniref:photosystem I reaction center subunit PsaK n=1 Tax=Ancylothrix sp. D3o TaxID=2953691 RepID=UPI0021BB3356|nr:Photosystem I reaction center subunit PsaK [Ancylothrix sp. D3o]MCT7951298.1 Photosystem I reaction center subunit PsaK [Ancylothrix sp. D3o]
MLNSMLLAVMQSTYTSTNANGTTEFIVMGVCNLLALFVLSRVIWHPHVGPKMPLPFPSLFNNVSVPAFLAAMSAGHILGALTILTLSTAGAI